MSRLWTSGAESGAMLTEGTTVAGTAPTFDTGTVRSGARSFKTAAPNAGASVLVFSLTGVLDRRYYIRGWLNISTPPTTGPTPILVINNDATQLALELVMSSTSTLRLQTSGGAVGSASASLTGWHCIELTLLVPTGGASTLFEFRVDGTVVQSWTGSVGANAIATINFGPWIIASGTETYFWDDLALNDDQGTSQNDYPGTGGVVLDLLPVADSARGANWFAGAAGTTNLWDAVNAQPPAGVAAANITITSQIRNATSDATGNYDAAIQSYTAAGVPAGATIAVVQGVLAAADSANTATSGAHLIVSNPTQSAEQSFSVSSTAGVFPTNWFAFLGAVQHAPTVTLGTQPVFRIGKRTATTRVLYSCYMALRIEYVPAASLPPAGTFVNQSVMRAATW